MTVVLVIGAWLTPGALILLVGAVCARVERRTGRRADSLLLTRHERRDEGIAQVHLFPTSGRRVMAAPRKEASARLTPPEA